MRVITAPADPFRANACHRPRHDWVGALAESDDLAVVDLGRVRVGTPVWPVVERAALTIVVANSEVVSVVSSAEWLHDGGRVGRSPEPLRRHLDPPDIPLRRLELERVGVARGEELAREILPFLPGLVLVLFLLTFFPSLSMFLPRLVYG